MGTRRNAPISDTEMEVLRALWDHGPGTVRELHALYGHSDLGIHATVIEGGHIGLGDGIEVLEPDEQ